MKKVLIAMLAVGLASYVNAAAVKWSSGAVTDRNGSTISGSYANLTAVISFYTYDTVSGTYTDVSSTFGGTLSVSKASKGIYTGTTNDGMTSGTYYAQLVLTGIDGTTDAGWSYTSNYAEFTYDSTQYAVTQVNMKDLGAMVYTGTNYGWTSVPEPTSGLLLLLGMAGLALRRKHA